jgi:PAS domain S-box-containing protein
VVLVIDPKNGDIVDANPASCSFYGWSLEELTAKKITDINMLTEEQVFQEMEKAKSGQRRYFIFRHRLSNGDIRDVEVYSGPIKLHGKKLLYSVIHDITERKIAEEALRISEEKYKRIFENIPTSIIVIDKEGKIEDINPFHINDIGKGLTTKGDYIGNILMEMHPIKNAGLSEKIESVLEGASVEEKEVYFPTTTGGSEGFFNFKREPIIGPNDEAIGAVIIHEDITDRKLAENEKERLEEQLRQSHKMEAIGTLAGGIAHDFNNMLGIILGNTELAMDDVPEWNPARLNLEEIKTACLRAKDVVRQLLSFARKTDQERKPVKINPIVTGSLKLLRSSIPTSIEIRSNIPKESQIIFAEPTQINQVMINLCNNAAQAMEDEDGIIEISLDSMTLDESTAQSYELSPGRYVKLTVNDTGHGIDPEIKDRIFDPYFTTREVGKGSGMGLAVVHGIVMNHDGAITVDSEVGKETTFNVFIPIVRREPVPEVTIDEDLPTGKERVLFVDDEESIVRMGTQRLERLGYKVESTTSPIEALDLFRSKPDQFDLVITDLTMPKFTGDKLVKEILNIRPDMPIIICTGFSKKMDRDKAREIGAAGYLEKPHEKRSLARMVRQILDGKEG